MNGSQLNNAAATRPNVGAVVQQPAHLERPPIIGRDTLEFQNCSPQLFRVGRGGGVGIECK